MPFHGLSDIRSAVKAAIAEACERAISRMQSGSHAYLSAMFRIVPAASLEMVLDRYLETVKTSQNRGIRQGALEIIGIAGQIRPAMAEKYFSFMSQCAAFDREPAIRKVAAIITEDWRQLVTEQTAASASGQRPKGGPNRRRQDPAPGGAVIKLASTTVV